MLQEIYENPGLIRYINFNQSQNMNTRVYFISLVNRDGVVKWRGFFKDQDAAERFRRCVYDGYIPDYIRNVPVPSYVPGVTGNEDVTPILAVTEFLTSPTGSAESWTVPGDWNNADNSVECVGGGATGQNGGGAGQNGGNGGGGGAYSLGNNLTLSGSANYTIGAANGGDTWFDGTTIGNATVSAEGGAVQTGGAAANGNGDTKYSGGNGGNDGVYNEGRNGSGGGGGGAGGPTGAGQNGGNGVTASSIFDGGGGGGGGGSNGGSSSAGSNGSNVTGGAGGNGTGGSGGGTAGTNDSGSGGAGSSGGGGGGGGGVTGTAAGGPGGTGGSDTAWTTNGVGGGGGGGGGAGGFSSSTGGAGGDGANYGAGGGGGGPGAPGSGTGGAGGNGAQGIIVITYTPAAGGGERVFTYIID